MQDGGNSYGARELCRKLFFYIVHRFWYVFYGCQMLHDTIQLELVLPSLVTHQFSTKMAFLLPL